MHRFIALTALMLVADAPVAKGPSAEDVKAYQSVASKVGHDADANVKLALWCEQHGLEAERIRHLSLAVVADPTNATARGLLGLVRDGTHWRRPSEVADRVQRDASLAETLAQYNALRSKAANTPHDQEKLAFWCGQHGLEAERTAHLTKVVQLDPARESAWKKLGYKRHDGRWMTAEQITAATTESAAQKKADGEWRTRLQNWKQDLKRASKATEAEQALARVTDPRAVPSIWRVFASGSTADRGLAVQLLGQIEGPGASRALAMLAIFAPETGTRRAAGETLVRRDPRESVDLLISVLEKPLAYEVKPSGGPGDSGELFVEGEKYNVLRHYQPPALPQETLNLIGQRLNGIFVGGPDGIVSPSQASLIVNSMFNQNAIDPNVVGFLKGVATNPGSLGPIPGNLRSTTAAPLPGFGSQWFWTLQSRRDLNIMYNLQEARKAVLSANRALEQDIQQVEATNRGINARNDAALQTLQPLTGKDFAAEPERWKAWWTDQQGYAYRSESPTAKPTFEQVAFTYQPSFAAPPAAHSACFAAGTSVQTLDGHKPIETIQIGDRVLSQDPVSGALGYLPVLRVLHNPPAATLSLKLDDEVVTATGIHRFWKPGKGWIMARELKPGDRVRTVEGIAQVQSVNDARIQPVFNLEVGGGHSYFVGKSAALVHDNSLVQPVTTPFDALPELASVHEK